MYPRDLELDKKSLKRFLSYLKRDEKTGCLIWTGHKSKSGHGRYQVNGRGEQAHRIAFYLGGGHTTEDKPYVLHGCPHGPNPACCEFKHLRAGSRKDNELDREVDYFLRRCLEVDTGEWDPIYSNYSKDRAKSRKGCHPR